MHRIRALGIWTGLLALAALPIRPVDASEVLAPDTATRLSPSVLPVGQLDPQLQRRALEVLEEGRDLAGSPWADARLGAQAVMLYRPSEVGAAYVEVGLEGPGGEPRGFMVLSTGEHDAPIVQAAFAGEPPSARLAAQAGEAEPARFYRLGHTYVAEDATGRLLGTLGELPAKMIGYDPQWLELDPAARSGRAHWDDVSGYAESRPSIPFELSFQAWPSWDVLKAEYASNRAPLHARDRIAAAEAWKAERLLQDNGETLQAGQFRELPLLPRDGARFQVSGSGARYVDVVLAERAYEGDTVLRAFVHEVDEAGVHPVDIDVEYADGTVETLRLGVTAELPPQGVLGAPVRASRPGDSPSDSGGGSSVREVIRPVALSGLDCSKVAFETSGGGYLQRSGTSVAGGGHLPDGDALFAVDHMGGGRVNLRASNGKWLRAVGQGGGDVRADAIGPTAEAIFRIFEKRDKPGWYGLQSPDRRHFLVAHGGGTVDARATRSRWSYFRPAYCEPTRLQGRWAGSSFDNAWSKVRKYNQIPARVAPSTSQCASGCGGTAWAMLFGFHDYEASLGIPKWKKHKGLYRKDGSKNGPDEVAPEWFRSGGGIHAGVANIVWEIASYMNDWGLAGCSPTGEKWTAPVIMGRAHKYLEGRVSGIALGSNYDGAMIFTHEGKTNARGVILDGQPVVIGMQDPHHYPLAFGWTSAKYRVWNRSQKKWSDLATRQHFVVHMGHEERVAEMVPYDSWFQGWLRAPEVANAEPAKAAPQPKTEESPKTPVYIPPKKLPKAPVNPQPLPGPSPQPIWK